MTDYFSRYFSHLQKGKPLNHSFCICFFLPYCMMERTQRIPAESSACTTFNRTASVDFLPDDYGQKTSAVPVKFILQKERL